VPVRESAMDADLVVRRSVGLDQDLVRQRANVLPVARQCPVALRDRVHAAYPVALADREVGKRRLADVVREIELAEEAVVARFVDLRRREVVHEGHGERDRLAGVVLEEAPAEGRRPAISEAVSHLAEERLLLEPNARQLPILEVSGRERRAHEGRVSGRELLADRVARIVVVEDSADPAPRSAPVRDEPDLLVRALVAGGFPRIGGKRRKLLVAPSLIEQEVRLIPLTVLLEIGKSGR